MAELATVLTGQATVSSTTGSQISSAGASAIQGVVVQALKANTTTVYIGGSSAVTTSTGFELPAGATQLFPVENLDELWVVTSAAAQKVSYAVI